MNMRSYQGKVFVVASSNSVIRDDNLTPQWLKKNAPKHGFVRAVSKESWHWEYRPAEAPKLAPGQFMLPGIHD